MNTAAIIADLNEWSEVLEALERGRPIRPGDAGTEAVGFTAERFHDDSYLWLQDDRLWISLIIAKTPGEGHFSYMIRALEADGHSLIVPTPTGKMPIILTHLGFARGEIMTDVGPCEAWARATANE